ncbi:hypothetical protein HDU78_011763, partial [Chytriomyces hyalinus]
MPMTPKEEQVWGLLKQVIKANLVSCRCKGCGAPDKWTINPMPGNGTKNYLYMQCSQCKLTDKANKTTPNYEKKARNIKVPDFIGLYLAGMDPTIQGQILSLLQPDPPAGQPSVFDYQPVRKRGTSGSFSESTTKRPSQVQFEDFHEDEATESEIEELVRKIPVFPPAATMSAKIHPPQPTPVTPRPASSSRPASAGGAPATPAPTPARAPVNPVKPAPVNSTPTRPSAAASASSAPANPANPANPSQPNQPKMQVVTLSYFQEVLEEAMESAMKKFVKEKTSLEHQFAARLEQQAAEILELKQAILDFTTAPPSTHRAPSTRAASVTSTAAPTSASASTRTWAQVASQPPVSPSSLSVPQQQAIESILDRKLTNTQTIQPAPAVEQVQFYRELTPIEVQHHVALLYIVGVKANTTYSHFRKQLSTLGFHVKEILNISKISAATTELLVNAPFAGFLSQEFKKIGFK